MVSSVLLPADAALSFFLDECRESLQADAFETETCIPVGTVQLPGSKPLRVTRYYLEDEGSCVLRTLRTLPVKVDWDIRCPIRVDGNTWVVESHPPLQLEWSGEVAGYRIVKDGSRDPE